MKNISSLLVIACVTKTLAFGSCSASAHSVAPTAKQPHEAIPTTFIPPIPNSPRISLIRPGDVVPSWTLPRILNDTVLPRTQTPRTTLPAPWSSRDLLGWHSLALIVAGRNFSPTWLPQWQNASTSLVLRNSDTALVVSSAQAAALKTQAVTMSSSAILQDPNGALAALFGLEPSTSALVVIDRAGILRRVQPLHSANDLRLTFSQLQDPTPTVAEGQAAPEFRVLDMNGNARRLSDYSGRNLLLTFFPKCFTGGCTVHLSSLRDEYAKLQAANVEVLAVSVDASDGEHGQKAFAKKLDLPFDLVPDTGRNLSILYGAANSPDQLAARISVLIDKDGTVRWIDKQINLKTHGADVLAKVQELGMAAGK